MRKITCLLLFLVCAGCSRSIYQSHKNVAGQTIPQIISTSISKVLNVPVYDPKMRVGDKFLLIFSPGIPFKESDLSFVAADSVHMPQSELNKAYSFSKLVNTVIPNSQFNANNPSLGMNADLIEKCFDAGIFPTRELLGVFVSTNITYNDKYYYTFVNPRVATAQWTNVVYNEYRTDSVKHKNRYVYFNDPVSVFSAGIKILNVERPWLDLCCKIKQPDSVIGERFAVIKDVILAKNIHVATYADNILKISPGGRLLEQPEPRGRMDTDSSVIIAVTCIIL